MINIDQVLLKEAEAARSLGVSVSCLRKWRWEDSQRIQRGEAPAGPPWRKVGRLVRYPASALLRWVESRPGGGSAVE